MKNKVFIRTRVRHHHQNRWLFIGLGASFVVVVVFIGARFTLSKINQPSVAVLNVGQSTKDQTSFDIDLKPKPETGKYVSYNYPTGLTSKPGQIAGPVVEDFIFAARDVRSWTLAIEISNIRAGQLTDSSSYTLRKNNPATYTESHVVIKGQSIDIMTDGTVEGFGKVAYIVHNNLLGTVSLTGNDRTGIQPLQTSFDMVLNSWHWLNQ